MPTTLQKRAAIISARLRKHYPDSRCTLRHNSPEQLLVATILSAQCTDKRVSQVAPALFAKYPSAAAFAAADLEELKADIRSTGFHNHKARSIKNAMKMIVERYQGKVPDTMDALLTLPGVGRKTANVVLGDGYGIPGVVVDTHVLRLSRRLGLTIHSDPVKVERDLMRLFPQSEWTLLGHLMIDHGRAHCRARAPRCMPCFMNDICPSARVNKTLPNEE